MAQKRILTALMVEKAKARPGRRYDLPDGPGGIPGLALRVGEHGAKTFSLRYRIHGGMKRITLGKHPVMTLAGARTAARKKLQLLEQGIDPAAAEKKEAKPDTVAAVAGQYVERHLKRNTRRWHDVEQMLDRDVLPVLGNRLIRAVSKRELIEVVDAVVDRGSPVSANRVLSLIKGLFAWAVERDILEVNVAAGMKPPHKEVPRERELRAAEIRALWGAFEVMGNPFGAIGKLLLLTGLRRGEVAGLAWQEIDFENAVLRLPAARMKNGRPHELPLPPAAVEILRGVPRVKRSAADANKEQFSPLVFPSSRLRSDRPVSGFTKARLKADELALQLLRKEAAERGENPKEVKLAPWCWHDLRRAVRTNLGRLGVAPHISERILAHLIGKKVERTYDVHRYGDEMRQALKLWSAELERIVHGAKVVEFRPKTA